MRLIESRNVHAHAVTDVITSDVVLGLHWTPPQLKASPAALPANLDAVCLLSDVRGLPLEVVHPGNIRNTNGSVLHTGDSRTGASTWDDERVFAFLHAIPDAVDTLTFSVVSASGHAFCDVAGARCHVSDHATEGTLIEIELTALGAIDHYCVATLQRFGHGWILGTGEPRNCHLGSVA